MYTLLEFGIRFCNAFIFSLILLLLLCSTNSTRQYHNRTSLITKFYRQLYYNPTFSDKLWTSAALLLFDELRRGAAFVATSSTNASRPSCKSIQKFNRSNSKPKLNKFYGTNTQHKEHNWLPHSRSRTRPGHCRSLQPTKTQFRHSRENKRRWRSSFRPERGDPSRK